jgi:hypothetical protein
VLSLGAPADYGNLGGAVFNVVTRQGSNTFHGDANFYYQNQSLTGRNTTDAQDNKQPIHRDEFKDTTVQLGGPAIKDKLWFFGSFQYQKDSIRSLAPTRRFRRSRPPSATSGRSTTN